MKVGTHASKRVERALTAYIVALRAEKAAHDAWLTESKRCQAAQMANMDARDAHALASSETKAARARLDQLLLTEHVR